MDNILLNPVVLAALVVWSLTWKGVSLWKAARNGHKEWYVVLLFINSVGILDIIYIKFFQNAKPSAKTHKKS